jgi:hypothetical protein
MIFDDLIPLFYILPIGFISYLFYHRFSSIRKDENRKALAVEKQKSKNENFNKIDEIITNAPQIIAEIDKMIIEMQARGATEDQLNPLLEKRKMLMYAVKYGDLWNMGGKEIVSSVLSLVKGKIGI